MPKDTNARKLNWARESGYHFQKEYNKRQIKHIGVNFNRITDADVLEWWDNLPNKAEWLRTKIREEIAKASVANAEAPTSPSDPENA